MHLKPVRDFISIIKEDKENVNVSNGGIVVVTTGKEKPDTAIVTGVGPDVTSDIEVGQRITYLKDHVEETEVNREMFYALKEDGLVGIVSDEENTIIPLRIFLTLEKEEDEKTTPGGIQLLREQKDKPRIGNVLSVGPGAYDENGEYVDCGVQVGDKIAYDKTFEKTFDVNGNEVTCLMINGILGKVK